MPDESWNLGVLIRQLQGRMKTVDATLAAGDAVTAGLATTVTTLPTTGLVDGQLAVVQVDATNGVEWLFRYRSGSGSTYKWESVGSTPLYNEQTANDAISSGTYAAGPTPGPSITVPLAGDYVVSLGADVLVADTGGGGAVDCLMSFAIGGTSAVDADAVRVYASGHIGGHMSTVARSRRKTGLTAGTVLAARYKTSGTSAGVLNRWMSVTPVRVI